MRLDTNRATHRAVLVAEEKEPIKFSGTGFAVEFYAASQFEVEAEFTFTKGYPPILTGPWEDADPGCPPQIELVHLRTVKDVDFVSDEMNTCEPLLILTARAGRDLLKNFSTREIGLFEDELLARAITGDTDD